MSLSVRFTQVSLYLKEIIHTNEVIYFINFQTDSTESTISWRVKEVIAATICSLKYQINFDAAKMNLKMIKDKQYNKRK